MFEKGLLAAKRILVTGGGSGLGAAMGRRFVELGAELIICGRRLELLEATAARLRDDLGGKVSADAKVGGTVGDPQFIGDVRWKNGKVVAIAPSKPAARR